MSRFQTDTDTDADAPIPFALTPLGSAAAEIADIEAELDQ